MLKSAIPAYTEQQLEAVTALQKDAVDEIVKYGLELQTKNSEVLKNHVPTHLKKQVENISSVNLFDDITYAPVSVMLNEGYMTSKWTSNEVCTAYIVK